MSVASSCDTFRSLGVVPTQVKQGKMYHFLRWWDSGTAAHTISTPGTDTTYTARFGVPLYLPIASRR